VPELDSLPEVIITPNPELGFAPEGFAYDLRRTGGATGSTTTTAGRTALGTLLGTAGSVLMLLLMPGNMGPEGTGNLPSPPPPPPPPDDPPPPEPEPYVDLPEPFSDDMFVDIPTLPDVVVVGYRPPPQSPGGAPVGEDPIQPPNWNDLSDPHGRIFESAPGRRPVSDPTRLPFPDVDSNVTSAPFGPTPPASQPVGVPGTVDLPLESPFEFQPGTAPSYSPSLPAPHVFPAPLELPAPGPSFDPYGEPVPLPGTGPAPGPGTGTAPQPDIVADPFGYPVGVPNPTGFPDYSPLTPPDGYRPPVPPPGGTSLPEFFTSPAPDILEDPFSDRAEPPRPDDECQCDERKKKKKKPKRDRDICYRGTYVQHKKGISYRRLKQVPCTASDAKKKTNTSRSPASARPGGFNPLSLSF